MNPHEKAQRGLDLMKDAILEILGDKTSGLRNAEISDILEIHSDYQGSQKDYLSWSILGLLMNEGKVIRKEKKYFIAGQQTQ